MDAEPVAPAPPHAARQDHLAGEWRRSQSRHRTHTRLPPTDCSQVARAICRSRGRALGRSGRARPASWACPRGDYERALSLRRRSGRTADIDGLRRGHARYQSFAVCRSDESKRAASSYWVASFNGGSTPTPWVIVPSENVPTTSGNYLYGLSCISAGDCWAVGYYYSGTINGEETLTEHDTGSGWIREKESNPGRSENHLWGVTCVGASGCWAVGDYHNGTAYQPLVEQNNGSGWGMVKVQDHGVGLEHKLYGVTCVDAANCWAVGYYSNSGGAHQTLVERNTGLGWSIVASENTSVMQDDQLRSVSCISASDCWAVGFYNNGKAGNADQTLIEHYDGSGWVLFPSANQGVGLSNDLYGVSCVSANDCWAVGSYHAADSDAYETLLEHYAGTTWELASGNVTAISRLYDLTCSRSGECWAVGDYNPDVYFRTLVEKYSGDAWSMVSSQNGSTYGNSLNGVTCTSDTNCLAVGSYASTPANTAETLIERNG
jgi:hypothetical protein